MSAAEGFAWHADRFGPPMETLRWEPRSWDPPASGSVLVEVAAAGVGLPDALMLEGTYPMVRSAPVTPGQEVCGRVIAAPDGSQFAVGDRIVGPTRFYAGAGGFATHTYVTEGPASRVSDAFTDVEAAGFFVPFRTAHTALVVRCAAQAGERVLVLGGSGSSGAAAIALACALDLHVVAMASTDEKREFCRGLGAHEVIDRDADAIQAAVADHTDGRGFDIVFDPVGGAIGATAGSALARHGRFALVGFASGSWAALDPAQLVMRNASAVGVLAAGFAPAEDAAHNAELAAMAGAGRLASIIGRVAPMAEVPAVLAALRAGGQPGKVVVSI